MSDSLQFTPAAQLLIGILLLFLGKKLFWLFVAGMGFFAGVQFGGQMFPELDNGLLLAASLGLGVLGALIALALPRLAVIVAGGLAGGLIAMQLAPNVGLHADGSSWLAFTCGALLVAVLFSALFDPMLIGISALAGAVMITGAFDIGDVLQGLGTVVLFVLGVAVQVRMARRSAMLV